MEDREKNWINNSTDDLDDIDNYTEDNPITKEQEAFKQELIGVLQSLIDQEEYNYNSDNSARDQTIITEKFTSQQNLVNHFKKHCLANIPGRQSTKNKIYYDFNTIKSYAKYEQKIYNTFTKSHCQYINDIYNVTEVNKKFRALFAGNYNLFISGIFGLRNSNGIVSLGIHSFSSDVTTNYKGGNTIDICVLTSSLSTITLYPVEASLFKKELTRVLQKYSSLSLTSSTEDTKLFDSYNNFRDYYTDD